MLAPVHVGRVRGGGRAPDLRALLADLRAAQADLRVLVERTDLELATPARGQDVRDAVAHPADTDVEATRAARDPARFVAELAEDVGALLAGQLLERRDLSRPQLLAACQDGAAMAQREPAGDVRVEVAAPGVAPGRGDRAGPPCRRPLDLCLVVAQPSHRDDTDDVATGPLAADRLAIT